MNKPISKVPGSRGISREKLVDQVYRILREDIISGELSPGTRLYQEEICGQLGVSRTPVREAFNKLEKDGLLKVSRIGTAEVRKLDAKSVVELYEVREVLDGLAAKLAALRRSREDLHDLNECISTMRTAVDKSNWNEWLHGNIGFHEVLYQAAKNAVLLECMSLIHVSAQTFYPAILSCPSRACAAINEHEAILRAIEQQDADLAECMALHHIRCALELARQDFFNDTSLEHG